MKLFALSILLAALGLFTNHALAQTSYTPPPAATASADYAMPPAGPRQEVPWNGGSRDMTDGMTSGPRIGAAFEAIKAGNFVRAEEVFAKYVRQNPRDAAAHLYLGATRMDLGKWEDAKTSLERAARKLPRHPDPKARLGVTYAKLGDTAAAYSQRAELVKMTNSCKNVCKLSPYIKEGIQMIDAALAEGPGRG